MPALVFYGGFRSFLAGDDLSVFSVVAFAIRLVQLLVVLVITGITFGLLDALRPDVYELNELCGGNGNDDGTFIYFSRPRLVNHSYEIVVVYLFSAYLTTVVGLILEILIWKAGLKGTPTQQEERAALKTLCCIKMIPLSVLRIWNVLLAIMVIYILRDLCSCGGTLDDYTEMCPTYPTWRGWLACLMVTHFIEASAVGIFSCFFLKQTAGRAPLPACFDPETKWMFLCKCCCTISALLTCCLYGGTDSNTTDFAEIGLILADFFDSGGKLDVVLSDIMLGIRMLARVQRLQEDAARKELMETIAADTKKPESTRHIDTNANTDEGSKENIYTDSTMAEWLQNADPEQQDRSSSETRLMAENSDRRSQLVRRKSVVFQIKRDETNDHGVVEPTVRTVLSGRNRQDVLAIAEGARFIQLSNSIYEFKLSALESALSQLCCGLGEKAKKGASLWCGTNENTILGIPIGAGFQLAEYAESKLLQMTGLQDSGIKLVYVQFKIGLARQPYCISLDHEWKSIVVAVRGTYSLDDVVADLTILPESLAEWGKKCDFDGEGCFVHSGMLRSTVWIYNDLEAHGILDDLMQKPELAGYTVRLTGHSLGAGCAAILSFLLKSKYPSLRCHCFCPPGCTMSENLADRCKTYLTSYVFDHDIVPRLTLDSMDHFRDDIFEMIARVKLTKRDAIQAIRGNSELTQQDLMYGSDQIPPSKYYDQLKEFHEYQESVRLKRSTSTRGVSLFPPGQIVHLVRTTEQIKEKSSGCCFGGAETANEAAEIITPMDYAARWAHRSDFAEIVISSHMVSDHSAPVMLNELKSTANLFGVGPPFLVEEVEGDDDVVDSA